MKARYYLIAIVLVSLLAAQGLAVVSNVHESIADTYSTGENLRGSLNITLNKTNLDSKLESNFGNSVSLRTLLEVNGFNSGDYNCSTPDCLPTYTRNGEINSLNFAGDSKLIGFALQGQQLSNIQQTSLVIQSNSAPSCFLDLGVDLLNSSNYLISSSAYIDHECYAPRYGCFETNRSDYITVTLQPNINYCEKILLPMAPAFRLGTQLVKSTQGLAPLKMGMYSLDGTLLKECTLPSFSQDNQPIECIAPYSLAVQQEVFVCLSALGPSNYKIRTETNQACGTNDFGSNYPGDYELYAKNLQFDTPRIEISQSSFFNKTGLNLDEYLASYVADRYGGVCSPYCIVPIRIFGSPQSLQLSNAYMKYTTTLGQIESNSVYDISLGTVLVTSKPLIVEIDEANFTLPQSAKSGSLKLTLDGQQIVNKRINITSGFIFSISPQFSTFGTDTNFNIITNVTINSSTWTFGDGSVAQTVSGKNAIHRYSQQGSFTINVEAKRSDGVVSKRNFVVSVGDAKTSANETLKQNKAHLKTLQNEIIKLAPWAQTLVMGQLSLKELNSSVAELQLRFAQATSDEEYASIVTDLLALNIPYNLSTGVRGTLPMIIGADSIDTSLIKEVSDREVNDDSSLQAAIAGWMNTNTNAEISFSTFNARYSHGEEPLATIFTLRTRPKDTIGEKTYLLLPYSLTDLHFAADYKALELEAGSYVQLEDRDQTFEFMLFDAISAEQLGAYIAPSVDSLGSFQEEDIICIENNICDKAGGETHANCPADCKPWGRIILWVSIIVFLGLVAWIGLHLWYKKNYERSLFPNKQDLMNIEAYIQTSKRNGLADKDMRKKLKNAGWSGEQIGYALKKIGKVKPIEQHTDARFIKRPEFK